MTARKTIVIGVLGAFRVWLLFLGMGALIAFFLWMALAHGYHRPHFEERQFGLGYFMPVILGLVTLMLMMRGSLGALLLHHGAALRIEDDRLVVFSQRAPLAEVKMVRFDPEGMFEGVPGAIIFELTSGRKLNAPTDAFKTSVMEIADRLMAASLPVDTRHLRPPPSTATDEAGAPR